MKRFSKIRSKRRYSQRRRRFRPKRRMMVRQPRAVYDGVYKAKCTADIDVVYNTGAGTPTIADIYIDWGTLPIYTATVTHPYFCFANTAQYLALGTVFREYRLRGFKVNYKIPQLTAYAGNPTSYFLYTELVKGTVINGGTAIPTNGSSPSDVVLQSCRDYKTWCPKSYTKFYVGVGKYWRKVDGQGWLATNVSASSPQAYNASAPGNFTYTCLRLYMNTSGAPMTTVATCRLDYYIEFRNPAV